MDKDYIVELKVRNGPMLRAMRLAGFDSASALARAAGVGQTQIGDFLNLKRPAMHVITGEWRVSVIRLSECLRCLPEDLFPPQHFKDALGKNRAEFEMSLEEIEALPMSAAALIEARTPEDAAIDSDIDAALRAGLATLTPRERDVIERRYGLNGNDIDTYGDIAASFDVSRELIRQIEARALRKLKRPVFSRPIIDAGYVKPRGSGDD